MHKRRISRKVVLKDRRIYEGNSLHACADGLTLHQGSCQPPLLTGPVEGNASGLEEREAALPGTQGLPDEAFAESQMFGGSHSLGRLLYERSQASDEPPPLSQTGPPIPSPSQ